MRLKIILGSVFVIAILVVGCGGGSGDSSSGTTGGDTGALSNATTDGSGATTNSEMGEGTSGEERTSGEDGAESKPLSQVEFATRVNEICIQVPPGYKEELKKLEKGGNKPSKEETTLKAAVPPIHAAIEQMESVTPPEGEEQKLEELVAALETAAKGLEEDPSLPLSGPQSSFDEFQKLTKKFNFQTCTGL
jgi:hypothetical protein